MNERLVEELRLSSHTRPDVPPAEAEYVLRYLETYGYLPYSSDEPSLSLTDISQAVADFQQFFGLTVDGYAGPLTVRAMMLPRCSVPDIIRPYHTDEHRHLVEAQTAGQDLRRWNKTNLSYYIQNYVTGLDRSIQDRVFDRAFAEWAQVSGLTFRRAQSGEIPDLVITTGRGRASAFDGPGGTLAMAELPNGRDRQLKAWFDLDETWVEAPNRGIYLLNVACHEFGHMLGLDHSRVAGALMAPTYNPAIAIPQLNDDVYRIQARYGPPAGSPTQPPVGGGGSGSSNKQIVITLSPESRVLAVSTP